MNTVLESSSPAISGTPSGGEIKTTTVQTEMWRDPAPAGTETLLSPKGQLLCGTDAWSREARIVVAFADEANIAIDDEALIHCDVRDLKILQSQLRRKVAK